MKLNLLPTLWFAILPQVTNAALVDNGTFTTDTSTSLDWLDMTETNGLSFNYVAGQLGSGGLWEGWRYASSDEVHALFVELGFTLGLDSGATSNAPPGFVTALDKFVALFGDTAGEYRPGDHYGVLGITSEYIAAPFHRRAGAYTYDGGASYVLETYVEHYNDEPSEMDASSNTYYGSYLVRATIPPPPEAFEPVPALSEWSVILASCLLGLAGLFGLRRGYS